MKYIDIEKTDSSERLVLAEREKPNCGNNEVLIKVAAAGLNRADTLQRKGLYPPPPGASDILGLEVAGEIVEVGKAVSQWSVGDKVCALLAGGGYAEYAAAPAGQCLPIPNDMSMVDAASFPEAIFTVYLMLYDRCNLTEGERLLIHGGSSGIGVTAIQLANTLGSSVVATAGTDEKCRYCEALGAQVAVNYKQQDFVERFESEYGKDCMDVILDMVGGDYIAKNMRLAATEGRIINIAYQQGFKASLNFVPMIMKRLVMSAYTLRAQSVDTKAALGTQIRETVWPLVLSRKIVAVVDKTFPLSEAEEAHRYLLQGQHIGKIILQVSD